MHELVKVKVQWNAKIKKQLLIKFKVYEQDYLTFYDQTHHDSQFEMEFVSSAASMFITWDEF
jgi:hypothetical protein